MSMVAEAPPAELLTVGPVAVGHTADEILTREHIEPQWVQQDIVALGAVTTLGGYIGSGKSPFLLRLCAAIRQGRPFLQFASVRGGVPVAYLTEESPYTFDQGVRAAGIGQDLGFTAYYWDENHEVEYPEMVDQVAATVPGGMMAVDTAFFWAAMHQLGSENDPSVMQDVLKPLVKAASTYGCAVVAVAHTVKGFDRWDDEDADISAVRGSGAVVASSAVVLLYKKMREDPTSNTRFFRIGRSKMGYDPSNRDLYVSLTGTGLTARPGWAIAAQAVENRDLKVIALIEKMKPVKNADAREAWSGRKKDFDESIKAVHKAGKVTRTGTGKRGDPFMWDVPFE
jgi:RecA-family ATPase